MFSTLTFRVLLIGLVFLLSSALAEAQGHRADQVSDKVESAKRYLRAHAEELAISSDGVDDLLVTSQHTSTTTGTTHIYFQQHIDGIPVYNAIVNVAVDRDGRVFNVSSHAVDVERTASRNTAPGLSVEGAVEAAARALDLEITEPLRTVYSRDAKREALQQASETTEEVRLSGGGISSEEIRGQLTYVPTLDGDVQLAWVVEIATRDGQHVWQMGIDATTGAALVLVDLVDHDTWEAHASPFSSEPGLVSLAPLAESWAVPSAVSGSYSVYSVPVESPAHAGDPSVDLRTVEVNPADPTASPSGWHNDGTTAYTVTRGNNVHAYTDIDANGQPDPGSDPDGGAGLVFHFPLDLNAAPATYRDAAVTNLFYWNNVVHDVMYRYGFTEAAGNFQVDNFGNGGVGGDDVRAEAQDGSGTNNANFFTPSDGSRPRMQMYVWTAPAIVTANAPVGVAGNYAAGTAGFGPQLTAAGITGEVELGNDGTGVSETDACEPLVGFTPGRIALVDRGSCTFTSKVRNAQNAGAIAVIVADNVPGPVAGMGGSDPFVAIPSVRVTLETGNLFKVHLPGLNVTLKKDGEDRDSDFDNGVIVHEYAHGISNRLTGGPTASGCLPTSGTIGGVPFVSEQMGEGWSDYYALLFTDTNTDNRGIGTYVSFESPSGQGIRPYPYSTSFATNPSTYAGVADAATYSAPHGVGSIWAAMLWDMTRDLVDRHGFDGDVYAGDGGNNLSLLLVTEGLKLQGCYPGFVVGRDAILAADVAVTGGLNQCLVWKAFAERGLGYSADQGSFFSRFDGTEAFDLPAYCPTTFANAVGEVADLLAEGVLNKGQAKSLSSKLANAEQNAAQGQTQAALNLLDAFINQVDDFVAEGVLAADEGEILKNYAYSLKEGTLYGDGIARHAASADVRGAESSTGVPGEFALDGAYPNPFAAEATLRIALPEASQVTVTVYDVVGRTVAVLVDAERSAGWHDVTLDGRDLPSGVYFVRMATSGGFHQTQSLTLVR